MAPFLLKYVQVGASVSYSKISSSSHQMQADMDLHCLQNRFYIQVKHGKGKNILPKILTLSRHYFFLKTSAFNFCCIYKGTTG